MLNVFDPQSRKETWYFKQFKTDALGRPVYQRLKYNLVEYDGIPEGFIEPVSVAPWVDLVGGAGMGTVVNPAGVNGDQGGVVRIEFVAASRPFEVHSVDDWDAAAAAGNGWS